MGRITLQDILKLEQLPTLPTVAESVFNLLSEPKLSFEQLAELVQYDPGLTCSLLRAANGNVGGIREFNSIYQAIMELKPPRVLEILKDISFTKSTEAGHPHHEMLVQCWANCLSQGLAADAFRVLFDGGDSSILFLSGLLSDIGVIALIETDPEAYFNEVWSVRDQEDDIQIVEQYAFGFSHVSVGHELARCWRLGETFASSILQHHHEANGNFYSMISQSADRIVHFLDHHSADDEKREELNSQLKEYFDIQSEVVEEMLQLIQTRRRHLLAQYGLPVPASMVSA